MALILFENCALLDTSFPERRESYSVLVEDGRIKEVSDRPVTTGAEQRLDLKGKTLMPGLTDAHVHVTAVLADLSAQVHLPRTLIAARSGKILKDMLFRGFTTVRDAGGADWGIAEAVREGLFQGPRLLISGRGLSQTGGHGDSRSAFDPADACACAVSGGQLSRIADGVAEVRKAARDELRKGANQLKIMASGGVASPTDHIDNTQYSLEEIRAVVEEAQAARTYVMAHAYTAGAIKRAVECGVRSVEHANLVDPDTARYMKSRGVFAVPTMVTYEMLHRLGPSLGFPKKSLEKLDSVRLAALQALEILKAAGTRIGHGSDLLGEMVKYQSHEFTLKAQVLTNFEVIQAATATNAELFNMAGEIGVVEPGAYADLLVVDGNPLEDLNLLQEQGKYLKLIMKEGHIYKNELDN